MAKRKWITSPEICAICGEEVPAGIKSDNGWVTGGEMRLLKEGWSCVACATAPIADYDSSELANLPHDMWDRPGGRIQPKMPQRDWTSYSS